MWKTRKKISGAKTALLSSAHLLFSSIPLKSITYRLFFFNYAIIVKCKKSIHNLIDIFGTFDKRNFSKEIGFHYDEI